MRKRSAVLSKQRRDSSPMLILALVVASSFLIDSAQGAEIHSQPTVETSRAKANGFLKELRLRLQAGMAESPMAAIAVCQDEASQIAARWSDKDLEVRRTALKVRQSGNQPTDLDRATMQAFAKRLAAGESASTVEEFSVSSSGQVRYARALMTEAPCLVCHGENIAPAIAKTIGERYPQDQATGFRLGDLRGIVIVESRAP